MAFFQEHTTANANQTSVLNRFWLALAERVTGTVRVWLKQSTSNPSAALPKSGMPISHDVVTKLNIRAGFTAGPW